MFSERIKECCIISDDIEALTIRVENPQVKTKVTVNMYRPPNNKCSVPNFIQKLGAIIGKVHNGKAEVWVLGDLNINLFDKEHPNTVALDGLMQTKCLKAKNIWHYSA